MSQRPFTCDGYGQKQLYVLSSKILSFSLGTCTYVINTVERSTFEQILDVIPHLDGSSCFPEPYLEFEQC